MSQISFEYMPSNWRVPGAYAEFNNDFAIQGLVGQPYTVLLIGQMLSAGTATPLEQVQVTTPSQAAPLFGKGSMLADMVERYKLNDQVTKLICIPVLDNDAGAAAVKDITFTGPATVAGTLNLYIAGKVLQVGVSKDDTAEQIATAVAAAIPASSDYPITATASADKVSLTAKHKGENGTAIDVRFNYFTGQTFPAGVGASVAQKTPGSGNPNISDVISVFGDTWFNVITMPWTDASNLTALETELTVRFGPLKAIDGIAIAAHRGNHSALTTLGQSRNSPHLSIFESSGYPLNPESRAAMIAAQIAFSAQNDPARPFQTLGLLGDMAPAPSVRFEDSERNLLLFDGISTCYTDAGGVVRIERAVTTYTENEFGAPDPSYLDLNTLFTLSYLRYSWRARVLQKFPRFKLGKDGSRGDNVMTPKGMKNEMVALAGDWADAGLIESVEQFKTDMQIGIDPNDPNRLNMILPPDLMNQLRIMAARIDFRL
ncbi:phage tail sheath subtilisin-like domain-containing protein [Aliamphritea ceti]|uniref:phage tail sheath subtilisin-like domain-containing protein n=1 Tax=Aliamphritea ceti TaxID=1524258 RepID=UPI0021C2C206|nr:phage tail sheath subtilisin-like domain-containing protein [Aliamphritea ceti]